jgi:hypothetical protein
VESVKDFFDGHNLFGALIDGLPHNSVGSLTKSLLDVVPLQNMWLDFLSHYVTVKIFNFKIFHQAK